MRIRTRTAVSGKMLENSYDARVVQAIRKSRPMRGDGLRISRKTASETAYGRGSGIHIHIQYGREIEIDPELPQHAAHVEGRAARGIGRAPAQLRGRRVRRKTVARLEAGHLAAFLIHGDKKRMPRRGPSQRGGQPFHLRRIADIARELGVARIPFEQDHPAQVAGLNISKDSSAFLRLLPFETHEQHLPGHFFDGRGGKRGGTSPKAQEKAAQDKAAHSPEPSNSKTRVQKHIAIQVNLRQKKTCRPGTPSRFPVISKGLRVRVAGLLRRCRFHGIFVRGQLIRVGIVPAHTVGIPRPSSGNVGINDKPAAVLTVLHVLAGPAHGQPKHDEQHQKHKKGDDDPHGGKQEHKPRHHHGRNAGDDPSQKIRHGRILQSVALTPLF